MSIVVPDELSGKLNIGCGRQCHPEWCNVDLHAFDDSVMEHDIRTGLPFADGTFDVVYHSHVLEHLSPEQGEMLIHECFRVLRAGGILRIVVPDLERIAELYLQMLRKAWNGEKTAAENYNWMKLELLDQMVRSKSGGMMGPYMLDRGKLNEDFVNSRVGREVDSCEPARAGKPRPRFSWRQRLRSKLLNCRYSMTRSWVRLVMGPDYANAFQEGVFRQQGEVHRWMYDRYSLRQLCEKYGFCGFTVCHAEESQIERFNEYQLDLTGNSVRKPDSLFVECRRPAMAVAKAA
jgi:predicted SAM-dependent methyltransferase